MAVTENYQATAHTNKDLLNFVILWFFEGKCSLSHLSILDTASFLRGKETIAYFRTNAGIVNLVGAGYGKWHPEGNLCFQRMGCFFGLDRGPSYSSDRHGFNTAPCQFEARDGNSVVHCILRSICFHNTWFDKPICLASIEPWMNLCEFKVLVEGERRGKWVLSKVRCASPIVATPWTSTRKLDPSCVGWFHGWHCYPSNVKT